MNDSLQTLDGCAGESTPRAGAGAVAVDYVVRSTPDRPIVANRAAAAALRRLSEMRRASKRLDAAYAGAVALQLLVDSPWLESCTLNLTAESAYNDEGGHNRSISVNAADIKTVQEATFPTDIFNEGMFNEEEATAWIEELVEDDDAALYCAFRSSDSYEDLALKVCRTALADLLGQLRANGAASGSAAFRALWPQDDHSM